MMGAFVVQGDPTLQRTYEQVKQCVGDVPNVHFDTNPQVIGQPKVGAFQTGSGAVLLFSCLEGFGVAPTEAMWKYNAPVAGAVGVLCDQIVDGTTGFLVSTVYLCAARIVRLVQDRGLV